MGPERQIDIRNGLRSHGSSPVVDGDSSATDGSETTPSDVRMRVGSMYQADIPTYTAENLDYQQTKSDRAMTVWMPCSEPLLPEKEISEYVSVAKEKHGYNMEQALGMLYWHGHNVTRARTDLAQFTPVPDEWSVHDKNLFEQAFLFHGKSFHRIKQMLPEKTIGSLVKYYYSWKKTRSKTSMMDKNITSEHAMDSSSTDASDEEMSLLGRRFERGHKKTRLGGGGGGPRAAKERGGRRRARPARATRISLHELQALMTGAADAINLRLHTEQADLRRKMQENKQVLAELAVGAQPNIDQCRITTTPVKANPVWTESERLLAVQAISEFGADHESIAEVLGSKTAAHVRTFFSVYNKQYGLDALQEAHSRSRHQLPASNTPTPEQGPTSPVPAALDMHQ